MAERLTVETAARIMDITPRCLRKMMVDKKIDLGLVIQGGKSGRTEYLIFRSKLAKLTGRPSDYIWAEEET